DVFEHFRRLFLELAADRNAPVLGRLVFPEVPETALGFTAQGIEGAGSAEGFARRIRGAMDTAIRAGVAAPRHFEEIGLFSPGIGADRISDITTRLLVPRLGAYTARICQELNVPVAPTRLWTYRPQRNVDWRVPVDLTLPRNERSPSRRGVLLVPKSLLRRLPTINRDSFEDWLWDVHNLELRHRFNVEVKSELTSKVIDIANENVQWVRDFVATEEARGPQPYDLEADKDGEVRTYSQGFAWGFQGAPPDLGQPRSEREVFDFVQYLG